MRTISEKKTNEKKSEMDLLYLFSVTVDTYLILYVIRMYIYSGITIYKIGGLRLAIEMKC